MAIALLTRVYDDALPTGKPHAVNPLTALENTRDVFDTVARVNGSYVTFSTAIGGGANLSDGIVMTSFRADGTVIGSTKLILADHNASALVQANPEAPSATCQAPKSCFRNSPKPEQRWPVLWSCKTVPPLPGRS